jgi:holo-[acyl-carrier protein] synthase
MPVGVDLIEIARVRRALERYPAFRARCFTAAERAYCDARPNPAQHYAGRFAAKEAIGKALGFGVARSFAWREIEIVGRPKPRVRLSGRVQARARRAAAVSVDVSISHSRELATAVAVVDG